jgi:hypothetical protein
MRFVMCILLAVTIGTSCAKAAEFKVSTWEGVSVTIGILGELTAGDDVKFKNTVASVLQQGKWIEHVATYVSGDDLDTAEKIGEQIFTLRAGAWAPLDYGGANQPKHYICQEANINIESFPDSHKGDARCTCVGACFFMWAAGRGRNGGVVGIRAVRMDPKTYGLLSVTEAEKSYERAKDGGEGYLRKMGIPDEFARLPFSIGASYIWFLKPQDVASLTGIASPYAEALTRARCGEYTDDVRNDEKLRTAWWACHRDIRAEEARVGIAEWQKSFNK